MFAVHNVFSFRFARQHWRVFHARGVSAATGVITFAARGWGKTAVSMHLAAQAALGLPPADTALWLTPIADQGRAAWRELRRRYRRHLSRAHHTAARLEWFRAGALEFRSAFEPDHLRGKTYPAVVLDEASLIPAGAWTACIRPTQRRSTDWFVLLTTPRGRDWVWALSMERQDGEKQEQEERAAGLRAPQDGGPSSRPVHSGVEPPHSIPISSRCAFRFPAVWTDGTGVERNAANIDPARVQAARRETPSAVFAQEYLCEFAEPAAVCFRDVPRHIDREPRGPDAFKGPFVIGVDWGFAHDYTVACVLDRPSGRVVDFHRIRQAGSQWMCREIIELAKTCGGAFCLCDATSLQDQALEVLRAAGVWAGGFTFTAEAKTNLIEHLLLSWEHGRVCVPAYEPLLEELKTFERSFTPATRQRHYAAAPGIENHDDCIVALALAWWARSHFPGDWQWDAANPARRDLPPPVDWNANFL